MMKTTRRQGFSTLEIILVLLVVVILAAVGVAMFRNTPAPEPRDTCESNIKKLGQALLLYANDSDDRLPPVVVANPAVYGWGGAIYPYVKSRRPFQCPQQKGAPSHPDAPTGAGYTDYYFNENLDLLELKNVPFPGQTIMLGEGNDGQEAPTARYAKEDLIESWYLDISKPPYRHWDSAFYLYVDGHVLRLKPDYISSDRPGAPPRHAAATFLTK